MKWWKHVAALELRKILAYRTDFWVTFLGQILIQILVARAFWQMIYVSQGVSTMQGYTLEMMNMNYLIIPIGTRILAGENIGFFAREVYDGSFTRYLLYPLSVFQYKTITYLTYSLFYVFQLIIIYCLFRTLISSSPFMPSDIGNLIQGVMLFFLAAAVYGMMAISIEMISLWADNIWSLAVMLRFFVSFFGGGLIPLNFMPVWSQQTLLWTPFPYLISLPVRTIMGLSNYAEVSKGVFILLIWILFLWGVVKVMWKNGQHRYSGVGI